jgi:3-deoxy-manno-octulosonate cytidylyltransferase (CMP-KDO synthetase)
MQFIAIIPARMQSTRFPGKPLIDILGLPMIEHVRRRAELSHEIDEVIIATCDNDIRVVVEKHGGKVAMTSNKHECCTDRVAEAAQSANADIVINVQGDEPLFNPKMFKQLLKPLKQNSKILCTNLMSEIDSEEEFMNVNVVKVVCKLNGDAMCFSREPIPSLSKTKADGFKVYKQLGIYAYRKDFINWFGKTQTTPLERTETIDLLRPLEHGKPVRMILTSLQTIGVDTPADLEHAERLMKDDPLFGTY